MASIRKDIRSEIAKVGGDEVASRGDGKELRQLHAYRSSLEALDRGLSGGGLTRALIASSNERTKSRDGIIHGISQGYHAAAREASAGRDIAQAAFDRDTAKACLALQRANHGVHSVAFGQRFFRDAAQPLS